MKVAQSVGAIEAVSTPLGELEAVCVELKLPHKERVTLFVVLAEIVTMPLEDGDKDAVRHVEAKNVEVAHPDRVCDRV